MKSYALTVCYDDSVMTIDETVSIYSEIAAYMRILLYMLLGSSVEQ